MKFNMFTAFLCAALGVVFALACEDGFDVENGIEEEDNKESSCQEGYIGCYYSNNCIAIDPAKQNVCEVCEGTSTMLSGPWDNCGGLCVPLGNDDENCGACGKACASHEDCINSECVVTHPKDVKYEVSYSEGCIPNGKPGTVIAGDAVSSYFNLVKGSSISCTMTIDIKFESGWTFDFKQAAALAFSGVAESQSLAAKMNVNIDGATAQNSQTYTTQDDFYLDVPVASLVSPSCGATSSRITVSFDAATESPGYAVLDSFDTAIAFRRCQ